MATSPLPEPEQQRVAVSGQGQIDLATGGVTELVRPPIVADEGSETGERRPDVLDRGSVSQIEHRVGPTQHGAKGTGAR